MDNFTGRQITTFEDHTIILSDHKSVQDDLIPLKEIINAKNFSLQYDGSFRVMHYVGFYQRGNTRLQILPKVYSLSSPNREKETSAALKFVYKMILATEFSSFKLLDSNGISDIEEDLLEIFIRHFAEELLHLLEYQVSRDYTTEIESQQIIKGKIIFSETLRRHPISRHYHIVSYDEFGINNPLNQVLKSTCNFLRTKTNNKATRRKLILALNFMDTVLNVPLTAEAFDKVKFSKQNQAYKSILRLAKLFFKNRQPGMASGQQEMISFLVPLYSLFESYVASILKLLSTEQIKYHYHGLEGSLLEAMNGTSHIKLRPDYSVTRGNVKVAILDAKYKPLINIDRSLSLSEKDIHQLLAYALHWNVQSAVLIYPKYINSPVDKILVESFSLNSGFTLKIHVLQIDVVHRTTLELKSELNKILEPLIAG